MNPTEPLTSQEIIGALKNRRIDLDRYSVKRIALFGSYAAGTQTPASDIDLIVEFEQAAFDNYMGLISFLESLFGKSVDVLTPDGVESIRVKNVAQEVQRFSRRCNAGYSEPC